MDTECLNNFCVGDKLVIDVAVMCQQVTEIRQSCEDHVINLDDINIPVELFKSIFYPYCENFGIDKNYVCCNPYLKQYISFLPEYRTFNGKRFYLLEQILCNIENDISVPRSCFTVESLVELTNQITGINSLCELCGCASTLSSLTWSNIEDIINNYKLINNTACLIYPTCVVSVIFKTPTSGVENTIIRFNYRIINI